MIDEYREKLEKIDFEILKLLGKRFELAKKIGQVKKKSKIAIINEGIEKSKLDKLIELNKNQSLDSESIQKVWGTIFEASRNVQKKLQD